MEETTTVQPLTVEIVEEQSTIPAERTPKCTREFFLRPPDWRYNSAVAYLQDEHDGKNPVAPTDPIVQYTIRVLRACRNEDTRLYLDIVWPRVIEVFRLGTVARRTAITAEIEACIIHGKTPYEMANISSYIDPIIYDLYSKIFFDLSGITAIHAWINDFLFEPEKHQSNNILLRTRLLSYFGDLDGGIKSAITGMPCDATVKLQKQIASTERQKKVFDYMTKVTHMPNDMYVELMEAAVKSMTERDFQEHMRDRDDEGSSSLSELAANLEQGIRAFSQQEVAQASGSGFEFSNQYTPIILRKDTQDGK